MKCIFADPKYYIMKSVFLSLVLMLIVFQNVQSQELVYARLKGSFTVEELKAIFNNSYIQFPVRYFEIGYTSADAKGVKDTLTGLVVAPDWVYPTMVYQHGASSCKTCVPSRLGSTGGGEGRLSAVLAGAGYVVVTPDYVGMGNGRGFQSYVHSATINSATEDMLTAIQYFKVDGDTTNLFHTTDHLFITGYSQGGYAAMSFHKYMQEKYGTSSVTAATYLSGPYSLSGVMRDVTLGESPYFYPAYIPNTIMGYNEVYELFESAADFFNLVILNSSWKFELILSFEGRQS